MAKPIFTLSLLLFLINYSFGQKNGFKTGSPATKSYHAVIPYQNIEGKIIIPVSINNVNYKFLFDTGAPNILSSDLWATIGSEKGRTISVSDANEKKQDMQLVVVPELTVSNVTFKGTSALVYESTNNFLFECFDIHGIIGTNLLRESIVQINEKEKTLIISNQKKYFNLNKNEALELFLKSDQSSPYIKIKLNGNETGNEMVLVDTGASGFYDMCKRNFNIFKNHEIGIIVDSGYGSTSIGIYGAAESNEQFRVKIPELIIGNTKFTNAITTTGNDNNSRIGSDVLDYGIITLDFKKKKFYFQPYPDKTNLDLNEKLLGFTPVIADDKIVVGIVWDDNLKSQINSGDEVLEVNELNLQDVPLCDIITNGSPFKKVDSLNISIKNYKGEIKNFLMIKN